MPNTRTTRSWRRVLLATAACGLFGIGGALAQGLDMDVKPDAPLPPKPAVKAAPGSNVQDGITPLPGNINPNAATAPIPATPAPSPTPAVGTADTPATPTPVNAPATIVEQPAAIAPPAVEPEPVTLDHPKVIDTAKLQSGETTVSLYGVEGLTGASAQGLQGFLSNESDSHLSCQAQTNPGFVCLTADGTNVAQVALVNGAAKTTPDAPDSYRQQEAAAQDARRGVWANLPPPPETVKHPVVQDTSTLFADGKTYILDGVIGFEAPYTAQLQSYITANGDTVTCAPQNDAGHYACLMPDGTDIAKVALVNGAARVDDDAPDGYRVQQLDAVNNRRGYWATAPQAVLTAALAMPQPDVEYALVAGDDGTDGITYIDGAPVALIDGESVFLVYGDDDLGWGYYDHFHHWHGAPDRFRHHLDHFHPGGHGLRDHDAYHLSPAMRAHEETVRRDYGLHGREEAGMRGHEDAMRRDPALRGREEAGMRGREEAGMRAREEAGMRGREEAATRGREEAMRGGARPGMGGPMGRPGMGGPMGRPGGMAMAGGRPMGGAPGGFMRPGAGASAGGFHPGGMGGGMRAAPAVHASGGGGGKHK